MDMEYIYSAMVLHAAGKKIDENGITAVLKAAGVNVDPSRVKALVAGLEGVNIDEAIKSAAFAAVPAPAGASASAPSAGGKEEKKKEEKKKEEEAKVSEEEAASGLAALFG